MSGIAAEGLEAGSEIGSRTLASLEYGWKEGRNLLTSRDVLVIDEAGLVGSRQMERVLSAASAAGAKAVAGRRSRAVAGHRGGGGVPGAGGAARGRGDHGGSAAALNAAQAGIEAERPGFTQEVAGALQGDAELIGPAVAGADGRAWLVEVAEARQFLRQVAAEDEAKRQAASAAPAPAPAAVGCSPTPGAMAKELKGVERRLKTIEGKPALGLTPSTFKEDIWQAGLKASEQSVTTMRRESGTRLASRPLTEQMLAAGLPV